MRFVTITAVCTLLAISAIVSAHGGNNDPQVVHACIGNLSKVVRVVGVNGSCLTGPPAVAETAAHWAIRGPQGPAGTNGTNGANGLNGLNGTSVTFVGYFSGNQNGCPNGGVTYAAGAPPVNAYVCNGANGSGGGPGVRPAGPCFSNVNRYMDCGNGTVTDMVTGLIWLRRADCLAPTSWAQANQAAAALHDGDCGLTDGSSAGDWRLPSSAEWQATIARAEAMGCDPGLAPGLVLTDDAGDACILNGPTSFTGLAPNVFGTHGDSYTAFWSMNVHEHYVAQAWAVALDDGGVTFHDRYLPNDPNGNWGVWPVRGVTATKPPFEP